MGTHITPLSAVTRGTLAGAAGMAAMDLLLYRRYRAGGGHQPLLEWEFSAGLEAWDGAPAPAQVVKRVVEGFFRVQLDPRWARTANNVGHWGTGLAWGAQYGLVAGSLRRLAPWYGPLLGSGVFANSYVVLGLAKLYKPMWEYDRATLARDLSAHLVYGVVTAETFRLSTGRSRLIRR